MHIYCAVIVLPAHLLGFEIAQAFRRITNHFISANNTIFERVTRSPSAADIVRSGQAWGVWIICGFSTAFIAIIAMRWVVKQPIGWSTINFVFLVWLGLYVTVWKWDDQLLFVINGTLSSWPFGGSVGFFSGFVLGLILAATPWRNQKHRT